ncbi:DNA polymerase Y family protein [Paucibacter sp. APW11]|uniref:DNA polymerase Y family protein n=1 Tax=Roseateles aquae TaxID=3077235 RepID=A0ABU3PCM3_9BURK|nr:DNA polymerase Y family protein [Paucibacter sp. APW11]MDT9000336.1 DNA polymerase Y family protein [Paucibacter sp. APW11]
MSPLYWLALLAPAASPASPSPAAQQTLAWWSLQFTPRVALLEDAVVLELGASLRLFGGLAALQQRLLREAPAYGAQALAWAPSSLAALALSRRAEAVITPTMHTMHTDKALAALTQDLPPLLDALPLSSLSAAATHEAMLARLGCRRLGQLRALPRGPLARRFGAALLQALDQAYGQAPEAHAWVTAPEQFEARLELPFRVEHAPALGHYAEQLLRQLCAWLAARHAGVKRLTLHWQHDAMRSREAGSGGQLSLGTADASRDFGHLARLLREHLALLQLQAPVGELRLQADEVIALQELSQSLLPDAPEQAREPLNQLLERLAVRLGPERVRRVCLREDHRPERMQQWLAWGQVLPHSKVRAALQPQPSWLLDPPLPLQSRQERPVHQGQPLQILAGPQRIEGGWWDGAAGTEGADSAAGQVQRDYFLARSAEAGLLWIYQERLSVAEQRWYLHGVFA